MKKMVNKFYVNGILMEHNLSLRVTGPGSKNPGTEYINGTIDVATDKEKTNIIKINFTYVTPTYAASGKDNATFKVLKQIIDGDIKTVATGGENYVKVDGAIGVNDFYTERNGTEELVSAKRYEGSFVHLTNGFEPDEKARNWFETDIVITNVTEKEADEEKNLPAKAIVKGAIFSFRGALLPVEFSVIKPDAMNYFLGLDVSAKNPFFTKIKGLQVSETVVKRTEESGAFGEPSVREVTNIRKDYVITWAQGEPPIFDDESSITAEEFKKAIADRNTYLASVKARNDEYKASKAATPATKPVAAASNGGFNF